MLKVINQIKSSFGITRCIPCNSAGRNESYRSHVFAQLLVIASLLIYIHELHSYRG